MGEENVREAMHMELSTEKDYLYRSRKRCIAYGVKKDTILLDDKVLSPNELQERLSKNRELLVVAVPLMEELYNFVKGSNFFAVLTDREGCILNIIGDEKILSEAYAINMVPGAFMDEGSIGTNAVGTSLVEGAPIQISNDEHYIHACRRWVSSAAPIMAKGKVVGSLNLTGYSGFSHSHTLGIVVAVVGAIERIMEINERNKKVAYDMEHLNIILDSLDAGIITSDIDGKINIANSRIKDMLGYKGERIIGKNISGFIHDWESIKDLLLSDKAFTNRDIMVNIEEDKIELNVSIHPIYEGDIITEVTFVFKDVRKARKMASRLFASRAIYSFDKIIGKDKNFLRIIEYAKKISDSRSTILIMGESGTGKEVFAQSIHNYSSRKNEPFIAVNCGAIPRSLIESELFGYEEGAFTGARRGGHPGKFEIADGGTIFLDEIGDMPNDMQMRLLRVIEEGVITRIGSANQIYVDVRIIAATNKNLSQETRKGNFRKDLFYRLNVLPIYLPPLRERKGDIPLLLDYFMDSVSKKLNKKSIVIPEAHLKTLKEFKWPGIIRELENYVERLVNTESLHIIDEVEDKNSKNGGKAVLPLSAMEKQYIETVLEKYNWNITSSAKALDIGRNTLYRKLKKYNIKR